MTARGHRGARSNTWPERCCEAFVVRGDWAGADADAEEDCSDRGRQIASLPPCGFKHIVLPADASRCPKEVSIIPFSCYVPKRLPDEGRQRKKDAGCPKRLPGWARLGGETSSDLKGEIASDHNSFELKGEKHALRPRFEGPHKKRPMSTFDYGGIRFQLSVRNRRREMSRDTALPNTTPGNFSL